MLDGEELKKENENIKENANNIDVANEEEYYIVVYSSSNYCMPQHSEPYATREEAEADAKEFNDMQDYLYENAGSNILDVMMNSRSATVKGPFIKKKEDDGREKSK